LQPSWARTFRRDLHTRPHSHSHTQPTTHTRINEQNGGSSARLGWQVEILRIRRVAHTILKCRNYEGKQQKRAVVARAEAAAAAAATKN